MIPRNIERMQKALDTFEILRPYKEKGEKVPPLSSEAQMRVKDRIAVAEQRINELGGEAIDPARKHLAYTTEFLATPDFFEVLVDQENADFSAENFHLVVQMMQATFDTQGMRTLDGKRITVHTTEYIPGKDPQQLTEEQAFEVGMHELTHGKVEPKIENPQPGKTVRRTGTKVIVLEEGKEPVGKNVLLYEAQTDAVWIIATHPEAESWHDILSAFKTRQFRGDKIATDALEALTIVMDCAFPDFQTGVKFLAPAYFASEDIIMPLWNRVDAKSHDTASAMTYFAVANNRNHAEGMLEAAKGLSEVIKKQK